MLRLMAASHPVYSAGAECLTIRVHESLPSLETLRPAWEALLDQVPGASTFSTWEWLAPWWRAYAEGQKLHALGFHDSGGRLVALALLSIHHHQLCKGLSLSVLRLMGDGSGDSDNLDLLALPGYEEKMIDALLDYLDSRAGLWDICELNTMPLASPAGDVLLDRLRRRGWKNRRRLQPGIVIDLPENWENYRKQLPHNARAQLGRYLRRLEKSHTVRFRKCAGEDEIEFGLEALFRLHQARWQREGDQGSFAVPERRRFYRELSILLARRGWLELWLLDLDGQTVAAEFDFRYRDTVYMLQAGFDPEYWDKHVGYVLRSHVLQECIAGGVRRYDFLGGEGGYKERWGGQTRYYQSIYFARPWTWGSFCLRVLHYGRIAKDWLRSRMPRRVWASLRRARQTAGRWLRGELV